MAAFLHVVASMAVVFWAMPHRASAADVRVAAAANTVFEAWDFKCDGRDDHVEVYMALKRVQAQGCGTVWLSDGLFTLSKPLHILHSCITLRGHTRDSTVLKLRDRADAFWLAGFVRIVNTSDVTLRDLTLDGNRHNQLKYEQHGAKCYGVYTETSNRTLLDNLFVTRWIGYGIDPHGRKGAYRPGYNFTVSNCLVTENGHDGIAIDKTEQSWVVNNTVLRNGRHGIHVVTGSKHATIRGNVVRDNGFAYPGNTRPGLLPTGCGIALENNQNFSTRGALVADNHVSNSSAAGVCVSGVPGVRLARNTIRGRLCVLYGSNRPDALMAAELPAWEEGNVLECTEYS